MIVKNESNVIISTLENLWSYIKFDYWVISDTGSTDNTKELIIDFFNKKKVKGELFEDEWKDFGYNRTKALKEAYGKTDYVFIFDADDKIHGHFQLPDFTKDKYMLMFGSNVKYLRPLLVNNRRKWKFVGVLHEYLTTDEETNGTTETITGDYYILSGRTGNRNNNVNKYYDDAMILTKAYFKETIEGDLRLASRYAFYCAQSFRDTSKHVVDSIEWYKKVLELGGWEQEKYFSCIQLGVLLFKINKNEEALFYLLKAIEYDNERIEGVSMAMSYYHRSNNHLLVNLLYNKYKNYTLPKDRLFIYNDIYKNKEIEYFNFLSAIFTDNKESVCECAKKLIHTSNRKVVFSKLENYAKYADLEMLYILNDYLWENKNGDIKHLFKPWYTLYEKVKSELTQINTSMVESIRSFLSKNPRVFLSFENNGNLESFQETIHSITNTWMDADKVDYWFCVDNKIKGEDRSALRKKYKWINYHFDGGDIMEAVFAKMKELKPEYWIHLENGVFHTKMNYVLETGDKSQIAYNRHNSKTISDYTNKNYMNMEEELIESTEMSPKKEFAFSITPVSDTLKQKPKTFQEFKNLWNGKRKSINRITYEILEI